MIRIVASFFIVCILLPGCTGHGPEMHESIEYIDGWQRPVPPQAISPFEPKETVYVDEPLIELDSDWNMDVKLFSKFRYTAEFARRWRAKYGFTPTRPITTDREFFDALDLDYPGLKTVKEAVSSGDYSAAREAYLDYRSSCPRPYHLKQTKISAEAGEASVVEADSIIADPVFPACRPGIKFTLWGLMYHLDRAYRYTKDVKYMHAWLDMFNHWYVTYRPPQGRPKMYIAFVWIPYWRTMAAGGSVRTLADIETRLNNPHITLDKQKRFNVYKSILEHGEFLHRCNDVFMPSNWQTAQCEGMITIGAYFPEFGKAALWRELAWELTQEHMSKETYSDGTHCENSVSYASGVINQYFNVVRIARKCGLMIPDKFVAKWKSMYLWGIKIVPPTGSYVPVGDGGIGADGSFIKNIIIKGALEFADPFMKYFTERYPDEVKRTAEDLFENTAETLAAYNNVKPEKPPFTSILLPDTGWAVMRTSWDRDALYLFFDYGWDEAWHAHPDFGSFSLWAYGSPVATECGRSGAYEADISKRWYKQTIAHNTVMVDSRSMRKCVDNRLNQWWTGPDYDFVDATSDGYRWIGVLHNRRVLFVKPDYWIISDFLPGPSFYGTTFQTTGYHEFDWLVHFQPTELKIDARTKRIDTTNDAANVALVPLNAGDVELREFEGPIATSEGIIDAAYVSLHREGMAFVQFQTLLVPYRGDAPKIVTARLDADQTDRVHRQNVGYAIEVSGRRDLFLEPCDAEKKVSFEEYVFRGAVAHIRGADKNTGDRCLLLNADYLARGDRVLFQAPEPVAALEFTVRNGAGASVLDISSRSDLSGVIIYAPGVKEVRVNENLQRFSIEDGSVILN